MPPAGSRRCGALAFSPFSHLALLTPLVASLLPVGTHALSCPGQSQGLSYVAAVATSVVSSSTRRFYQAFYLVVVIFLLLLSLPTTQAFRAIPMQRRARARPALTQTSTSSQAMSREIPAITNSGSGLRLLSSTGSTSPIPTTHHVTTERSSTPSTAVDEDLPILSTPIADLLPVRADLLPVRARVDNQMASSNPSELIACLKASKVRGGMQQGQPDGESFQVRLCCVCMLQHI